MSDKKKGTINEQIDIQIQSIINQLPYPTLCAITQVYEDNSHVDVEIDIGTLTYCQTIGTPAVGNIGVVIFLNGSNDEYIIIC